MLTWNAIFGVLRFKLKRSIKLIMNIPPHIEAIFQEFLGKRDLAVADLQIYFSNSAGIGDHENIGDAIKKKLEEVDKYDSLLKTIMDMYPSLRRAAEQAQAEVQKKQAEQNPAAAPNPEHNLIQPEIGEKTDLYEDGRHLGSFKKPQNS